MAFKDRIKAIQAPPSFDKEELSRHFAQSVDRAVEQVLSKAEDDIKKGRVKTGFFGLKTTYSGTFYEVYVQGDYSNITPSFYRASLNDWANDHWTVRFPQEKMDFQRAIIERLEAEGFKCRIKKDQWGKEVIHYSITWE